MTFRMLAAGTALGALACGAAQAHHSAARFDQTAEVVLEGTLVEVDWKNPHLYLTLDVPGPDGATARQEIEGAPISALEALGLTRDALVVGEKVSVRARPNRQGPGRIVQGVELTTAGGATYPVIVHAGAKAPAPTVAAAGIAGRWTPTPMGVMKMRQGIPGWPLTDAGRAALADVEGLLPTQASCTPWPAPTLMAPPVLRTIEVGEREVTISSDWMDAERIVHLDQAAHPADLASSLQGHSIGHWEGETLVVDTAGFAPNREGVTFGVPGSAQKHLVERFALAPDRLHLSYTFTVEDPVYLTEPVTQTTEWSHRPDLEPSGVACDAETARRFLSD